MSTPSLSVAEDTPELRKARGAFFTPRAITDFIAQWAIQSPHDRVLEPSAGDAEFMVAAVRRKRALSTTPETQPAVDGIEIHADSAAEGIKRVREAGGIPSVEINDFFLATPQASYNAVIGNPPYIRYQSFTGTSRTRAREAALSAGVALSGQASSWAAFTVYATRFLATGGRMGLVLPAELLSTNYAAPVRKYLFDSFATVELVSFDEQVFPEAEADVVLLLASGYGQGPTDHARFRQATNAEALQALSDEALQWTPTVPESKWTANLVPPATATILQRLTDTSSFATLHDWGETTLGMVTGNNKYFVMSPERAETLGLPDRELLRMSPPGSAHLRGLSLSRKKWSALGAAGHSTLLFSPNPEDLSSAAQRYIAAGEDTGVDDAYKCRVRKTWYKVPDLQPADLLLTYMNADTPRLTTNEAKVRHLNSVHGVYLAEDLRDLGRDLLPLASLNSATLLHAEMVGRSYGGGILKIEPREADLWMMPTPALLRERTEQLRAIKPTVANHLSHGKLMAAVDLVDRALWGGDSLASAEQAALRQGYLQLSSRRTTRGASRGR